MLIKVIFIVKVFIRFSMGSVQGTWKQLVKFDCQSPTSVLLPYVNPRTTTGGVVSTPMT